MGPNDVGTRFDHFLILFYTDGSQCQPRHQRPEANAIHQRCRVVIRLASAFAGPSGSPLMNRTRELALRRAAPASFRRARASAARDLDDCLGCGLPLRAASPWAAP
jgi:hypothetical protein